MISGIFFIRNGNRLGYPYIESIQSMLPLVDELVIAAGDSDDGTTEALEKLASGEPKIKIVHSVWDMSPRKGLILSEQTNIAISHARAKDPSKDWLLLLQGDEVLHEKDYAEIREKFASLPSACEGLAFRYNHFYGGTNVIQHTCTSYRYEVRAIRPGLKSVGDGQSFRKENGKKPKAKLLYAHIYHYGWARPQQVMIEKTKDFDKLYSDKDKSLEGAQYRRLLGLFNFSGTHPAVMKDYLSKNPFHFDFKKYPLTWTWKDARKIIVDFFEFWTGHRLGERKTFHEFRR